MPPDEASFRTVLGHFATGVTIITAMNGNEPVGVSANAFTSVSLDPPLVLFCVGKATKTGQIIHSAKGFAVNILRQEQQDLSTYFAGGWTHPLPPAFTFVPWEGGPRLDGCAAAIGCSIHAIHEGGDHWIVVGEVRELHRTACKSPLVFHGSRYANLGGIFESEILVSGF